MTARVSVWVYVSLVWECAAALRGRVFSAALRAFTHAFLPSVLQVMNGLMQTTGWPSVVACVGNWFGKGKWVLKCAQLAVFPLTRQHFTVLLSLRLTFLHIWPCFDSSGKPSFDFPETTKHWVQICNTSCCLMTQWKLSAEALKARVVSPHHVLSDSKDKLQADNNHPCLLLAESTYIIYSII